MSRVIAVCGLVCALATCAQAREPEHTNPLHTPDAPPAAESGGSAAPPSAVMNSPQMRTLQRNLSRSSAGLRAEPLANGIQKVDLQGRFLHATVLDHRTPGLHRLVCVDHPAAMADLF